MKQIKFFYHLPNLFKFSLALNVSFDLAGRQRRGVFSLYASRQSRSPMKTMETNQMIDLKDSQESKKQYSRLKRVIDSEDSD